MVALFSIFSNVVKIYSYYIVTTYDHIQMYINIYIYIYIYIYTHDSQIVHHNPCFNLFILHSNPFDNQGSEINKNDIFLHFDILSFTKIYIKRER